MARAINSPGVQITEKDLSLRVANPAGTNIVIPGFASQGPVSEPLVITTSSELESIYGLPATAAERYFYYSCREVLNSPAILTTIRLPYGEETGSGFSNSYSGLFYPMLSAGTETGSVSAWEIGAPIHASLTPIQYQKIKEGDFEWTNTSDGNDADVQLDPTIEISAGFVVLNDLQTTVNEIAEGYYVGFADNLSVSETNSPNFNSINKLQSLSGDNVFSNVDSNRLDFALSATQTESARGVTSVSETLEKVGFIGFETTSYQDYLSFGIFKIRRSTSNGSVLSLATTEKYLGSLDASRKQISQSGGTLQNASIEDIVNENSPTVKVLINPQISRTFNWAVNSTVPTTRVTVKDEAKAIYAVSTYVPTTRLIENTKIIGDVPSKLDKALRLIETPENTTVDVITDAGLSTIYAYTDSAAVAAFDEAQYISNISNLAQPWQAVVNVLVTFAESTRKDCVAILDAPRAVFVMGKDSKVIDAEGKTFTADIYSPLRDFFSTIESNYSATYGNWVKISDFVSGRRCWVPFSGYAASIFAKSDAIANPWSAPAGLNRGIFNAVDIAFNPNQKQRDRLYEIAVNPVVFFTGDGYSIMGQKTLQNKPTAFDRINVRRLFLSLERAVSRTLKYFVFEPNTDFTRTRLRSTITPLFEFAKNTEGLYDYLIVADERNNTSDVIDNNELVVDIYIKPVRTAEFILVNFIATRTGQDFQELI